MIDREKVIKGLKHCDFGVSGTCYEKECPYYQSHDCTDELKNDILVLLKEQEAVKPKTITEELKQKMWNTLYAEEDAFEEKYVRTKEHDRWFLVYRPWLQEGFNLAIKAIEDYEGL